MRRVIDIHVLMGDIFLGRNVSFRTFQPRPEELDDHFAENGRRGFNFTVVGKTPAELEHRMRQGQRRLACATLENIGRSMDEEGVAYSALMPVYPYTGFEEYLAASGLDTRMIPFSSPDFSLPADRMVEKLKRDIARGARGLKIHSVLQNVKMNDPRTRAAVEVFGRAGLPVMFHIGVSYYYLPEQDAAYPSLPEAGAIEDFFELARAFPDYPLIAAHCANKYAVELAEGTKGLDNVYTDTTLCSAERMLESVERLGEDKVLFGTDYPFSSLHDALREVDRAFPEESPRKDRLLYGNAARLLKL